MGYRVELLGISDFLPVYYICLDKDYSNTGPIKGLYLKNTRSTVKHQNKCGTDVPYQRTVLYCSSHTIQYGTVLDCTVSFVRPQRPRITKYRREPRGCSRYEWPEVFCGFQIV